MDSFVRQIPLDHDHGTSDREIELVARKNINIWLKNASPEVHSWIEESGFNAKEDKCLVVPRGKSGVQKVVVISDVSEPEDLSPYDFAFANRSVPGGTYRLSTDLSPVALRRFALGWQLGSYRFDRYKTEKSGRKPARLLLPPDVEISDLLELSESVFFGRDLVNTPAEDMGPSEISMTVLELAKCFGAEVEETVGEHLLERDCNLIHAVGRASADAPRLLDLRWGDKDAPKVTLVGKAVCFDTGGVLPKNFAGMRHMKTDMAGGALALALARQIMSVSLNVRLRVLIPAVENSISSNSYRPGDVFKSRKGLTVEVAHPDGEGRLALADALALADEEKPELLVSMATLTGAVGEALGEDIAAFLTKDESWERALLAKSKETADPMWPLPLGAPYKGLLKSKVADLCHITEGYGAAGSITAAQFLEHFVENARAYIHIDFSGWNSRPDAGFLEGGNVTGMRTLFAALQDRYGV